MTRSRLVTLVLLVTACVCGRPSVQAGDPPSTSTSTASSPLSWLAGCWVSEDGRTYERWTDAGHGYLFGHNVVFDENGVRFFEQLRIAPGDKGPVFNAYPAGVGPSPFPSTSWGEQTVTFANAQHDFPQQITYTRKGATLQASIALIDGSKQRTWSFSTCPDER